MRRRCNAVRSGIAVKLNSKWARAAAELLQVGDTFDEQIEIEPLSPLPFRMTRNTTYRVMVADLLRAWEVRGETGDGWLRIRYDLEPVAAGTRFTRTSTFELRGPGVLPMPFLRRRMAIRAMILRGDRTFGPLVTRDQNGLFASAGNHEAVSFATALFASVLKEHG